MLCTVQELTVILSTLLPVVSINNDSKEYSNYSVGLKVQLPLQLHSLICSVFWLGSDFASSFKLLKLRRFFMFSILDVKPFIVRLLFTPGIFSPLILFYGLNSSNISPLRYILLSMLVLCSVPMADFGNSRLILIFDRPV